MDTLREEVMVNQFVMAAGCATEQARQLLQSKHWDFQVRTTRFCFALTIFVIILFTPLYSFKSNRDFFLLDCIKYLFPRSSYSFSPKSSGKRNSWVYFQKISCTPVKHGR